MNASLRVFIARLAALIALGCVAGGASHGAEKAGVPDGRREVIPGSELMTHGERERYRQRLRGARSADEESRLRDDHLRMVRERARQRGLRLAEPEPAAGAQK